MVLKDNTSEQLVTFVTCMYIYLYLYIAKHFYCSKEKFDFLSLILCNLIQMVSGYCLVTRISVTWKYKY